MARIPQPALPLTDEFLPRHGAQTPAGRDGAVALETVLREYGASLGRIARIYAPRPADREDLLQDIAVALLRALPRFRGESSLGTFVYRVALNRAITRRARRPPEALDLADVAEPLDPAPGPEQRHIDAERRDRLVAAVRRLPTALGAVVMLSLEGLSHAEVAEVLGISENNVAVRALRARALLRESLEDVNEQRS
jgi:RNA polymerase sigma factor (sigma-70 family)